MGAAAVVATDGLEDALELARATWQKNSAALCCGKKPPSTTCPFLTTRFRWGWDDPAELLSKGVALLSGGGFSKLLILASECVYPTTTSKDLASLFSTVATLLEMWRKDGGLGCTKGELLLAYTPRKHAVGIEMLKAAAAAGLIWDAWAPPVGEKNGCNTSLGEEAGAVMLCFSLGGGGILVEEKVRELTLKVFPGVFLALQREDELRKEMEAEANEWTGPPL